MSIMLGARPKAWLDKAKIGGTSKASINPVWRDVTISSAPIGTGRNPSSL